MTELETQVVKIQLGDNRQSTTFVYTLAETIDSIGTELYVIAELPMFNPAAKDECQRISEAIAGSLKRTYRRSTNIGIFEIALSNINEELSKLVTLGKTHWLGKLNAVVAVKRHNILSVSSVGKISALLYRDKKFVSVTDSSTSNNQPLKTFEQFSEGKLKLGDMFVLSTPELLNHISIDRIKSLIDKNDLPIAAQSMIEYLQDDMGPDVACGTIFALQVEPGTTTDEEVDLNQYLAGPKVSISDSNDTGEKNFKKKAKEYASTGALIARNFLSDFKSKYVKQSYWKGVASKSSQSIGVMHGRLKKTAAKFQPSQISGYSRSKKFFLACAGILLIALVANLIIAKVNTSKEQAQVEYSDKIGSIEKLLNDANAALLYGDEAQAAEHYNQAKDLLAAMPADVSESEFADKYNELKNTASELDKKINKIEQAKVTSVGSLGNSSHLINLPDYLATEVNRTIVAYQKSTNSFVDNSLKSSEPIVDSIAINNNLAAIYNGSELFIWDVAGDIVTGRFNEGVPSKDDFGGIKTYSTNNKVYLLDKAEGVVKSYSTTSRSFTTPSTSIQDNAIKGGSDLAIDGNIYIAVDGTILKYNSGAKQEFSPAVSGFGNNTKLYTQTDYTNLYVLDSSNKRIIILDKAGNLVKNLTSDKFTDPKDFAVDEKAKTIYILNGSELLKTVF